MPIPDGYPIDKWPVVGDAVEVHHPWSIEFCHAVVAYVPADHSRGVNLTWLDCNGVPCPMEGSPHDPTGEKKSHWRWPAESYATTADHDDIVALEARVAELESRLCELDGRLAQTADSDRGGDEDE